MGSDRFTKKTNIWGKTSYYDSKGNLIGEETTTWGGTRIIKDSNGNTIGKPEMDEYGRSTIKLEKKGSFFSPSKTKTLLSQWEPDVEDLCENCGEEMDGDDDLYCEDCEDDHF